MSDPHPGDEVLLKLLDGELAETAASTYRLHLEACWTCRTRLEELDATIGEYVRYRDTIRQRIPAPPAPWNDLRERLAEYDRAIETPPVTSRISERNSGESRRYKLPIRPLRWLAAAAAATIVVALVRRFESVPVNGATELLRKAAAAEQSPDSRRRIQIRTRTRTFTRPAAMTASDAASLDKDLRQIFERAHFSWERPLSARSFAAWRDQLPDKLDAAPVTGDSVDVVQTSTSTGELRKATLTLRSGDLQSLSETLEFANETVNISQAPGAEIEATAASPERPATQASTLRPAVSLFHTELLVFSALRRVGADLGEPVEVAPEDGRLKVTGSGLTTARKQQLQKSLAGIPNVYVDLEDTTGNQRAGNPPADRITPATAPPQLRLQTILGSPGSAENFINRVLDQSDEAMARAHALRTLSQTFSSAVENLLTPGDHDILAGLRNDHAAALAQRLEELRNTLHPILNPQRQAAGTLPGVSTDHTWQTAAQSLFAAAQNMDQTLNGAFAGARSDVEDNDFERIAGALGRLEMQLEQFRRVAGMKP